MKLKIMLLGAIFCSLTLTCAQQPTTKARTKIPKPSNLILKKCRQIPYPILHPDYQALLPRCANSDTDRAHQAVISLLEEWINNNL